MRKFFALLIIVGVLASLSACSLTKLQYEHEWDIVSSENESHIDMNELQSVLKERGEDGWQLVALGETVINNKASTIAIFRRQAHH